MTSDVAATLNAPLPQNDAGAATVREYLAKLLCEVLAHQEGFDGKRPFGNSGWINELTDPLVEEGLARDDSNAMLLLLRAASAFGEFEHLVPEEEPFDLEAHRARCLKEKQEAWDTAGDMVGRSTAATEVRLAVAKWLSGDY